MRDIGHSYVVSGLAFEEKDSGLPILIDGELGEALTTYSGSSVF